VVHDQPYGMVGQTTLVNSQWYVVTYGQAFSLYQGPVARQKLSYKKKSSTEDVPKT
jgi:hypothetical protein